MNTRTKEALIKFTEEVDALAYGSIHMIGQKQVQDQWEASKNLRDALQSDETITETI